MTNSHNSLNIISANVRGLLTNIGDLTYSFIIPHKPDIVATVETFFNDQVPDNYGKVDGYSNWYRRDRKEGQKGGIAVCFKKDLPVQLLDVNIPVHLEIMFFKVIISEHENILFCVCYRPQWQGNEPIEFLQQNLDNLLIENSCNKLIIVGDLNQYLVRHAFEEFLNTHGLINHVDFPTHDSGSSLDPVITDFADPLILCQPLGNVGSSDHQAIHTKVTIQRVKKEAYTRTIWLWRSADWKGMVESLANVPWNNVLTGPVNNQAENLTNILLEKRNQYIPSRSYKVRPQDQPWFGYQCREAADAKSREWKRYKSHPNIQNRERHRASCKRMEQVQKWAIKKWLENIETKLKGRPIGNKDWWNLANQQQGLTNDTTIPPLNRPDGTVAVSGKDKAELLAYHFAQKMQVPDPNLKPPKLPIYTSARLNNYKTTRKEVETLLKEIDVNKALGPDEISPHILKNCATVLAEPLARLYNTCIDQKVWPRIWKQAQVVATHKRKSRTSIENYRPISLLSILGKIYEKILVNNLIIFLDKNHLLSNRQFGFRKNRSTADLLLKKASEWNKSLDSGKTTFVIALDIAGAFDRVWHAGLISKLKSLGINGNLLHLIENYLEERTMQVVVDGFKSTEYNIEASVPQGSVLGPLLWNIYFNDLLNLVDEACAYADDCTLDFSCDKDDVHIVQKINEILQKIQTWGERWQVSFASEKSQLMVISRCTWSVNIPPIKLGDNEIEMKNSINILGVEFDKNLSYTSHIKELCSRVAKKFACLRRMARHLDAKGCELLYNAQIRSVMEYSHLVWSSTPPSYLKLLDKIQERVQILVNSKLCNNDPPINFQSLQHRRNVSGLCVYYKIQIQGASHLINLKLPPARPSYETRNSRNYQYKVQIPFCRTETHLRSFIPKYARMWNEIISDFPSDKLRSMELFKKEINKYLYSFNTP